MTEPHRPSPFSVVQPVKVMTRVWQNLKPALDFLSFRRNNAKGFPRYLNINDSGAFNRQWGQRPRSQWTGGQGALFNAIDYLF